MNNSSVGEKGFSDAVSSIFSDINWISENKGKLQSSKIRPVVKRIADQIISLTGFNILNPRDTKFELITDENKRKLTLVLILQLFTESKLIFADAARFQILNILEENYGDFLFQKNRRQSHEKEADILRYLSIANFKIAELDDIYLDSSNIDAARNKFYRVYNDASVKIIYQPLLSHYVDLSKINNIFESIKTYFDSNIGQVYIAYENFHEILNKYLREIRDINIKGLEYIKSMLNKFSRYIEEDFSKKGYANPSCIVVESTNKKYDFKNIERDISLAVTLKNTEIGRATDVELSLDFDNSFLPQDCLKYVGEIDAGESTVIYFNGKILQPTEFLVAEGIVSWRDYLKQKNEKVELIFFAQKSDVNWNDALDSDPYSSEPVDNEHDLIGRKVELNQLRPKKKAGSVSSYVLYGQKRVGKTSIARTLQTSLLEESDVVPIFLEIGSVIHNDIHVTIDKIVTKIASDIKRNDNSLKEIDLPTCDGSLSPLDNFLSEVKDLKPYTRYIIMIDEFDELPQQMYRKGEIADSFFLTIRSISHMKNYGFILIGGEKMEYLLNHYGDKLNKFDPMRVDYFDKSEKWSDFESLVKHPVIGILEISDEAIVKLYDVSAGNPFFTKLICRHMFDLMIQKRETYVSQDDMDLSIKKTLLSIDGKSFAHFWEDGIIERGEYHVQISLLRKRIFVSIGLLIKRGSPISYNEILTQFSLNGWEYSSLRTELDNLIRRQILVLSDNDVYDIRVGLFRYWLSESGLKYLSTTLNDKDYEDEIRRSTKKLEVSSAEIAKWCARVNSYKSREITTDIVRTWLDQFGDPNNQRLAFSLLQELKYYSQNEIRIKMKDAFSIVARNITIDATKRKISEIVVTNIGKFGKSSVFYARLFADENQIYIDNVMEKEKLLDFVTSNSSVQSVVMIDDIAATGGTIVDGIDFLEKELLETCKNRKIAFKVIVICATEKAIRRIEEALEKSDLDIKFHACDIIPDKCYLSSENFESKLMSDANSLKRMVSEFGVRVKRNYEMGYGGDGILVVFETNCPNNAPAVLWCETKEWKALFPR